jgi:hypothetical protein
MRARCLDVAATAAWLMAGAVTLVAIPTTSSAARRVSCDSCAACSAELQRPGAIVELSADITADTGGACITVTGADAQLNGNGFTIQGGAPAVRADSNGALLRTVRVSGAEVGVEVAAAKVTVLDPRIEGTGIGISAAAAPEVRVVRGEITGGRIGVALGAPGTDGRCADGAPLRQPGAVIRGLTVTGAGVGIAACEAMPVLESNKVLGNRTGVVLGKPQPEKGRAVAYDPCVCQPTLDGVEPGTLLFFSSGCGGCEVHEGWLPEVRGAGHDNIRLRRTGVENKEAQARFDAYTRQCAPEIIDAIGIPGCVPNYGCPADGRVAKRRDPGGRLARDVPIGNAGQVGEFAASCRAAGAAHYHKNQGQACVKHPLRDNVFCGSAEADILASAGLSMVGSGNTCAKLDGLPTEVCSQGCDGVAVPAPPKTDAAAVATAAPAVAETEAAPPAEAPEGEIAAKSAPEQPDAPGGAPGWMIWVLVGLGGIGGFLMLRGRPG